MKYGCKNEKLCEDWGVFMSRLCHLGVVTGKGNRRGNYLWIRLNTDLLRSLEYNSFSQYNNCADICFYSDFKDEETKTQRYQTISLKCVHLKFKPITFNKIETGDPPESSLHGVWEPLSPFPQAALWCFSF